MKASIPRLIFLFFKDVTLHCLGWFQGVETAKKLAIDAQPYVSKAVEAAKPLALEAFEKAKPILKQGQEKASALVSDAQEKLKAKLNEGN